MPARVRVSYGEKTTPAEVIAMTASPAFRRAATGLAFAAIVAVVLAVSLGPGALRAAPSGTTPRAILPMVASDSATGAEATATPTAAATTTATATSTTTATPSSDTSN